MDSRTSEGNKTGRFTFREKGRGRRGVRRAERKVQDARKENKKAVGNKSESGRELCKCKSHISYSEGERKT